MKLIDTLHELLYEARTFPMNGDCFDSSFDYMMKHGKENPNLRLVHGYVSGQGSIKGYRFAHGWCEDGDEVIDVSNGGNRKLPKDLYYAIGNIYPNQCKYYSYKTVMENMAPKFGFKGPWEIKNKYFKEKFNPETRQFD